MKKLLKLLFGAFVSLALVGCGSSTSSDTTTDTTESTSEASAEDESTGYEIALITDVGTIDDKSFNQGSWEGVVQYAEENGITHKYYQPTESSTEAITTAIELAIKGGAKTVVCPGYLFEVSVYNMQSKYPDVNFIIIDGTPCESEAEDAETLITDNTISIYFSEQEAGFLAGYAIVKEGYTNLGFMGGYAMPAVIRYGYGFIQGADYAAKELGLSPGDVTINYTYVGNFEATPDNTTKASAWYNDGVDVIFACGGGVGNSVMKAAEGIDGKKVIGVDVDQSEESDTVITSAMKNLQKAIYEQLDAIYSGTFEGGRSITLDAETESVLLPMETSLFETFTQEEYDEIFAQIAAKEITINDDTIAAVPTGIETEVVVINYTE